MQHFTIKPTLNRLSLSFALVFFLGMASLQAQSQPYAYINGPASVACGTSAGYSIFVDGGTLNYATWTVSFPDGTSTSGGGSFISVPVPSVSGTIYINAYVSVRSSANGYNYQQTLYKTTAVISARLATPANITGNVHGCTANSNRTFNTTSVSGATGYQWSIASPFKLVNPSNGALVNTLTTSSPSVSVRFPGSGSSTGSLSVKAVSGASCLTDSYSRSLTIYFGPQIQTISGPNSLQRNGSGGVYYVSSTTSSNHNWSVPPGWTKTNTNSSSRIVAEPVTGGSGSIVVAYQTCGVSYSASKWVEVTSGGGRDRAFFTESEELGSLVVYPNPASEGQTLKIQSEETITKIKVLNTLGQVIAANAPESNSFALPTQDLKAGNYTLIAETGTHTTMQNLVIQ